MFSWVSIQFQSTKTKKQLATFMVRLSNIYIAINLDTIRMRNPKLYFLFRLILKSVSQTPKHEAVFLLSDNHPHLLFFFLEKTHSSKTIHGL